MTSYHILRFTGEGGDKEPPKYALVGRNITASSPRAAIRLYASRASENASGLYAAVPSRSWAPVKVEAQVQTTLKLTEAK